MLPQKCRTLPKNGPFALFHASCISALKTYVAEAEKFCEMLSESQGEARNVIEDIDLIAQRDRESEAQVDYIRARKRLLRASRICLARRAFHRRIVGSSRPTPPCTTPWLASLSEPYLPRSAEHVPYSPVAPNRDTPHRSLLRDNVVESALAARSLLPPRAS